MANQAGKPSTSKNSNDVTRKTAASTETPKIRPPTQTPQEAAAAIAQHNAEQDSIEAALPILPRGFVENTAEIYAEVASFDVIPTEKLREYWRGRSSVHPPWAIPYRYGN